MNKCSITVPSHGEGVASLAFVESCTFPSTVFKRSSQVTLRDIGIMRGTGLHLAKRASDDITSSYILIILTYSLATPLTHTLNQWSDT